MYVCNIFENGDLFSVFKNIGISVGQIQNNDKIDLKEVLWARDTEQRQQSLVFH